MTTLDEEAIRGGHINWPTFLYQRRIAARREAERAAREHQAALMAKRREQLQPAGSGSSECYPVPKPSF